jgi:hypothetical protein
MKYTATADNGFEMQPISNKDVANVIKYAIKNDGKNNKGSSDSMVTISQTGGGDIKTGGGENITIEETKK